MNNTSMENIEFSSNMIRFYINSLLSTKDLTFEQKTAKVWEIIHKLIFENSTPQKLFVD